MALAGCAAGSGDADAGGGVGAVAAETSVQLDVTNDEVVDAFADDGGDGATTPDDAEDGAQTQSDMLVVTDGGEGDDLDSDGGGGDGTLEDTTQNDTDAALADGDSLDADLSDVEPDAMTDSLEDINLDAIANVDAADLDSDALADVDSVADDGDGESGDGDGDMGDGDDAADAADGADGADAGDTTVQDTGPIDVISFDATQVPTQVTAQQTDLLALPQVDFVDVTSLFGFAPSKEWVQCVAVGDTDADGDDDVVLIRKVPNQQMQIVAMELSTAAYPSAVVSAIDVSLLVPTSACKLVDLDADGDADLLMGGASGLALYTNIGGSKFVDASAQALPPILTVVPTSIAPADYDGDGDIDLYVGGGDVPGDCTSTLCKYDSGDFTCMYPPGWLQTPTSQDRMLRNDNGVFIDVTTTWAIPNDSGYMSTAADVDLDLDGHVDVLVGSDFGPQMLLRSNGKTYLQQASAAGISAYGHAMGWGIGDLDGDGWVDLVQTDLGPGHLWQRKPPVGPLALDVAPDFVDRANDWGLYGLTYATSNWSPLLHDFDHDGDLDIYLGISMFSFSPSMFETFLDTCGFDTTGFKGVDLLIRNDLSTSGGFAAARVSPASQ